MKKLLLVAILAAAATAAACNGSKESTPASSSPAASGGGNKKATIYFTKNLDQGTGTGQYSAACIGIVSTEHIFGDKGKTITWKVKKNGGEPGQDDDCTADLSKVNLQFDNSMAVSPNPAYVDSNDEITVTVSSNEGDYNSSKRQKYQVYINATTPAGPDPIIIVNCSSCGPGGGGRGD